MKRIVLLVMVILVPCLMTGLVFLSVQHYLAQREIQRLEALQTRIIDRNTRYIVQESIVSGAQYVRVKAEEEYGLSFADSDRIVYFQIADPEGVRYE